MKRASAIFVFGSTLFGLIPVCQAVPVTFAQFTQQVGGNDFDLIFNNISSDNCATPGTCSNTLDGTSPVNFTYLNILGLPPELQGFQDATFTFSATTFTPASDDGTTTSQNNYVGQFTILRNAAFNGLTNLLSGTFGNVGSNLTGPTNGNSATISDSSPPVNEVVFTSDFVTFGDTTTEAFSNSFSSVNPALVRNTFNYLTPFTAAGSGTFSADPGPSSVPEPTTLFLVGFTLVGIGLRRRRFQTADATPYASR